MPELLAEYKRVTRYSLMWPCSDLDCPKWQTCEGVIYFDNVRGELVCEIEREDEIV